MVKRMVQSNSGVTSDLDKTTRHRDFMCSKTISTISPLIYRGEVKIIDLTTMIKDRIDQLDQRVKSFCLTLFDGALERATQLDAEIQRGFWRGPLHGIPIAIKDMIDIKGHPTTCGTTMLAGQTRDITATVVERLIDAGAIIIGKTQLTEAMNPWYHPSIVPPVNPWNPDLTPGLSSSGSAVAVAAGLCFAALGSDIACSVRFPAAMNNLTGIKPTLGRVPWYGAHSDASFLDTIGPIARSAMDAAIVLSVIAGGDVRDPVSSARAVPDYQNQLGGGVSGLVVGLDESELEANSDAETVRAVLEAARTFERAGARLRSIRLPKLDPSALFPLLLAEIADSHRSTYPQHAAEYGPDLAALLDFAQGIAAADVAASLNFATKLKVQLENLFEDVDLLLMPTLPTSALKVGAVEEMIRSGSREGTECLRYMLPFNATGNPAISLPAGFDEDGTPLAVELVGRHWDELSLFRAGNAFQARTDWHARRPPAFSLL